jgi:hypothetical protein
MNRTNRIELACPFSAEVRAAHCRGCMEVNAQMPPCVAAWLRSESGRMEQPAEVIPLRMERRKAA